ncbi:hypothetical protein K435DRAFT_645520 [Dendrothele bispora CBS 962.96]|uniref:Uncharacterized protein n=1 Tax=Dendrothele bispora (strain CBS 962.96) TaxID=1314807 RepID=A0A4S8MTH0_DENBC|nr:hypothetical protein K435DRAFT_645520 [Dendrothele bispora CBS 962.96]
MAAIHGLDYDKSFLDALPRTATDDIPILTATQFDALHHSHILSHPPDSVLFPFLHGIEGDNEVQNIFFATQGQQCSAMRSSGQDDGSSTRKFKAKVPRYRALTWVICEEDLENPQKDLKDLDDDDEESDDIADVDLDGDDERELDGLTNDDDEDDDEASSEDEKHMHPVQHRAGNNNNADGNVNARGGNMNGGHVVSPSGYSSTEESGNSESDEQVQNVQFSSDSSFDTTNSNPPLPHHSTTSSPSSSTRSSTNSSPQPRTRRRQQPHPSPPILTSTFRARELLRRVPDDEGGWEFLPLKVPEGISLRNFGIQVPIVTTLSDIIIYSPTPSGAAKSAKAIKLAKRFRQALRRKWVERVGELVFSYIFSLPPQTNLKPEDLPLEYNVFVLDATAEDIRRDLPHLVARPCKEGEVPGTSSSRLAPSSSTSSLSSSSSASKINVVLSPNTVDFAQRERDEMRDLTRASEIISVFPEGHAHQSEDEIDFSTTQRYWDPTVGQVFLGNANDVPLPVGDRTEWELEKGTTKNSAHETTYARPVGNAPIQNYGYDICIECHEQAPFSTLAHLKAAEQKIALLEETWKQRLGDLTDILPPRPAPHPNSVIHLPMPGSPLGNTASVNAIMPLVRFLQKCLEPAEPVKMRRSFTSPAPRSPSSSPSRRSDSMTTSHSPRRQWSRPLKVLVYSSDGYTESSLLALCILMAFKSLDLPHAYLELQVEKRRSFFVYQMDLGLLRRVEDREGKRRGWRESLERGREWSGRGGTALTLGAHSGAKSVSFARGHGYGPDALPSSSSYALGPPMSSSLPSLPSSTMDKTIDGRIGGCKIGRRPRASTSPWLPSLFGGDHQNWFNDHRFDGSFPSRVLPFLYLGNLNHASNVYMLQALGITHVVSVGECALVPPSNQHNGRHFGSSRASGHGHFISGKSDHQGSLWIEERAGRIKVLDIQGVCDDGIDTLEPQLEPICDWIDEARQEGGQVLVHCRVGVSRSATVTIAYVMKHLSLPLVDAYLIVRSRRLSVLIQPNMRLLYNLLGWEIKLAKERAGNDERKLRYELSSALSWPYLAREVHALNEKYLR